MRVLVTGGASGLGAALTAALRARGDQVLVGDLAVEGFETGLDTLAGARYSTSEIADARSSTSEGAIHLDVRSENDWNAARAWVEEHWGGLDMLVNNAGVAGGGRVDVADLDEWQWITEINLFGVVRGVRTFTPMFKQQGSGTIVNIASLAGLVHPAGMASYNAVKAAVVAFTETIGHELASYGVNAHVVCPSYFRTNLISSLQGRDRALGDVIGRLIDNSPVSAGQIAAAVLEGVDAGTAVILPDEAARAAYGLKTSDRATYDQVMRAQAAKLEEEDR